METLIWSGGAYTEPCVETSPIDSNSSSPIDILGLGPSCVDLMSQQQGYNYFNFQSNSSQHVPYSQQYIDSRNVIANVHDVQHDNSNKFSYENVDQYFNTGELYANVDVPNAKPVDNTCPQVCDNNDNCHESVDQLFGDIEEFDEVLKETKIPEDLVKNIEITNEDDVFLNQIINLDIDETNVDRIVGNQLNSSIEIDSDVNKKNNVIDEDFIKGIWQDDTQQPKNKVHDEEVNIPESLPQVDNSQNLKSVPNILPQIGDAVFGSKKIPVASKNIKIQWTPDPQPGPPKISDKKRIGAPVKKLNHEIKDYFHDEEVDVETVTKDEEPILQAKDVMSLYEQFEKCDYFNYETLEDLEKETASKGKTRIQGNSKRHITKKEDTIKDQSRRKQETTLMHSANKEENARKEKNIKKYKTRSQGTKKNKPEQNLVTKIKETLVKINGSSDCSDKKLKPKDNHRFEGVKYPQVQKDEGMKQGKVDTTKPLHQPNKDKNHDKHLSKSEPPKVTSRCSSPRDKIVDVPKELIGRIKDSNKPRTIVLLDDPSFLGGDPVVQRKKNNKSKNPDKKPLSTSTKSNLIGVEATAKTTDRRVENDQAMMNPSTSAAQQKPTTNSSSASLQFTPNISPTNPDRNLENNNPLMNSRSSASEQKPKTISLSANSLIQPNTSPTPVQAINNSTKFAKEDRKMEDFKPVTNFSRCITQETNSPPNNLRFTPNNTSPSPVMLLKNSSSNKQTIIIPIKTAPAMSPVVPAPKSKANEELNRVLHNINMDHSYFKISSMQNEKENTLSTLKKEVIPACSFSQTNHAVGSKKVLCDVSSNKDSEIHQNGNNCENLEKNANGTQKTEDKETNRAPKKIWSFEEYRKMKGICPSKKLIIEPTEASKHEQSNKMNSNKVQETKKGNSALTENVLKPATPDEPRSEQDRRMTVVPETPIKLLRPVGQNVYVDACLVDEDALNKLDEMNAVLQRGNSKLTENSLINTFKDTIPNKSQSELDKVKVEFDGTLFNHEQIEEKPKMIDAEIQTNISLMKRKPLKRIRSESSDSSMDEYSSSSSDSRASSHCRSVPRTSPDSRTSRSPRMYQPVSGSSPLHMYNSNIQPPKSFRSRKEEEEFRDDAINRRILFLGEIPEDVDENELWSTFHIYGRIKKVKIYHRRTKRMRTASGSKSQNYAFITFYDRESAFDAMNNYKKDYPNGVDYLMCFGGRREFCKEQYSDYDNMPSNYRCEEYLRKQKTKTFEDLLDDYRKKRGYSQQTVKYSHKTKKSPNQGTR